jgi:hypothetical protein
MTAILDVRDLRKQFAIGRPAIDGVSFAVPAGEIVVLLGPSGSSIRPLDPSVSPAGPYRLPRRTFSFRRGCAISAWCSSPMRYGRT